MRYRLALVTAADADATGVTAAAAAAAAGDYSLASTLATTNEDRRLYSLARVLAGGVSCGPRHVGIRPRSGSYRTVATWTVSAADVLDRSRAILARIDLEDACGHGPLVVVLLGRTK